MEVFAHRGRGGHRGDRVGAQILRVRARVTNATNAIDRAHRPQELREKRPRRSTTREAARLQREITSVAVHVLAEEGDLGNPIGREPPNLVDHRRERPADFGTANGGHDAERARVVTPDLDRDPCGVADLTAGRQRRRKEHVVVGDRFVEDLGDRAARARLVHESRGAVHVVRTQDDVDVGRPGPNQLAIFLGEAARHDELHRRMLVLEALQMAEIAVEPVVGVLADAARVQDDDVGVGLRGGRHQAVGLEQTRDALGVVFVHLAPEGAHDVAARHPPRIRGRRRARRCLSVSRG